MNSTTGDVRRNVGLLAACQALLLTNTSGLVAINGLAGLSLAPHQAIATLPVTCWILGSAIATMPASLHMKRVGRRRGLTVGASFGIAGAILCASAMRFGSFWLLCLGTLVWGAYNAYGQYYRFAAADASTPDFRPTAISLVLAGGLAGGFLGPSSARIALDWLEPKFTGAYLALIGVPVATMLLLRYVTIPSPSAAEQAATGRPLREIAAQPRFIVAVLSAAIAYGVMNFIMTATPIAMQVCGYPFSDAASVISWHVVAMFGPSFFSGPLIKRIGTLPVMFIGALVNLGAIAVALAGISVAHFWWSLVLVGVGWNFLYIGGTTLLTTTYRPEERAKAQGANDQAIFIMMVLSSVTSGLTVTSAGWEQVNLVAAPLIGIIAAAIGWYWLQSRNQREAAA